MGASDAQACAIHAHERTETQMTKVKLLSTALAALLAFGLGGAPAFAQDEPAATTEAPAADAPADPASEASSDAAPADAAPAGEEAPAEQ